VRQLIHSILGLATSSTSQVVNEKGRQTGKVAGESGCARSESLYGFPLVWWFYLGFKVFVWVYICVFPLDLCYSYILSFGFMLFFNSFGFGYMLILCSFGFGYKVILDGRGEVCFTPWAREELWLENLFLTTTATQLGRELSDGGCTEIQGWWRGTGQWGSTETQG